MLTEQWIYFDAFEDLKRTQNLSLALDLQKQWRENSSGKNMASAACYYLSEFVIPALSGNRSSAFIPRWVNENLFNIPQEPKTIKDFLALFGSNYVESLSEREDGNGVRIDVKNFDDPLLSLSMTEDMKMQNRGLYFTPNPITGTTVSPKGSMRLDANVESFTSCFADFDGGDKIAQALALSLCLEPSIVVESKNGYHAYWMLEDEVTEDEWRKLQEGIIKKFNSDKAIKNPSRLMRLPFSWHCKTDDKFQVRIAQFKWKRYTKKELAEELAVDFNPKPISVRPSVDAPPRDLRIPSLNTLGAGARHPTLIEEAGRIYARLSQEKAQDARDMLHYWYERACQPLKQNWEKEVDDIADWAERREFSTVVSMRHT